MVHGKAAKTCIGSETMAYSSNNDIEAALSIKRTFLNLPHRQDYRVLLHNSLSLSMLAL